MTSFENIYLNLPPSYHNDIANKQQSQQNNHVSFKDIDKKVNIPTCFYHNQKQISFFCKNSRCTLPLCEKCIIVHRMQHLNRKQIPMQNVITFGQCKRFIIDLLSMSKNRVKSNQKQFERQLIKYRDKLIQIIDVTLDRLKQQLMIQDKQNSILRLQQINQSIQRINKDSCLSDIIKCYQDYYKDKQQQNLQQINIKQQNNRIKQQNNKKNNSIIDNIKFVPDQKSLTQIIQRGFLYCKFIKSSVTPLENKIDKNKYIHTLNQYSQSQKTQFQKTPIHKLQAYTLSSIKKLNHNKQVNDNKQKSQQQIEVKQFPIQSQKIIQIKRQLRKSIFNQKQNNPVAQKSYSFTHLSKLQINNSKQLPKQPLFSDVKKYKIKDSSQQIVLGKKKNIYTQNLNFQSHNSQQSSINNRSISNSSLKHRNKGLSLVRQRKSGNDHYLRKQKDSINKTKIRLLQANQNEQRQFSRDNSLNWKRVVNLTQSNVSFRNQSVQRKNIYNIKTQGNRNKIMGDINNSLQIDVLNPSQMRQLLIRKKNNKQ